MRGIQRTVEGMLLSLLLQPRPYIVFMCACAGYQHMYIFVLLSIHDNYLPILQNNAACHLHDIGCLLIAMISVVKK